MAVFIPPALVKAESVSCRDDPTPIERLLVNLESQSASSQSDWRWYENVARLHALAFAQTERVIDDCSAHMWFTAQGVGVGSTTPNVVTPPDAERANATVHLARAIDAYAQAVRLAPDMPLPRLGHAWTLQQAGRVTEAVTEYRHAIELAWPSEQRVIDQERRDPRSMGPFTNLEFITEDAARFLLPLLNPVSDAAEIATLRERSTFVAQRPRAISPIVVSSRREATIDTLLDPAASVTFDLDGFGARTWTWGTPDAGWLVFDPKDTRRITSGLQLFGNVTFWLFWENGYDALRALDDNGDGWLRGDELAGLAIWRDGNSDGISQPDEVATLAAWGITALSVSYVGDAEDPDVLASSVEGARFTDGTVRPTWDILLYAH